MVKHENTLNNSSQFFLLHPEHLEYRILFEEQTKEAVEHPPPERFNTKSKSLIKFDSDILPFFKHLKHYAMIRTIQF